MKKVAGMKVLPEEGELVPLVVRSVVLALVAYFATGRAENEEVRASAGLKVEETLEAKDAFARNYADYIREVEVEKAKCDGALEVYARHMGDPHEWDHVMAECHSETPRHDHEEEPPESP